MQLNGDWFKQFRDALLSAFPRQPELRQMVRFKLNKNLDAIATGENYSEVIFKLIEWAEANGILEKLLTDARKENPGNVELQRFEKQMLGHLTGSLLLEIQETDIETIKIILSREATNQNQDLLAKLISRSPITSLPNITETSTNLQIDWKGPTDEKELQGLFAREPQYLDVNELVQAIKQANSVCRVEFLGASAQGTGVLIAKNLVLTNYHVLKPNENADINANAHKTLLRFGCFTSKVGETFSLDNRNPIIASSPTNELDFVLLKVEDRILTASDIKPPEWDNHNLPTKGMAINLLQHPEGMTMQLVMNSNGVAYLDTKTGKIQYVTKTAQGSSGSPCFNQDWKLIALHHAEKATTFGSIREGILFSAIYKEIQKWL
ncbi:effector-associated domain EAD1-containing protein [Nostoc sp.]|uniref:effector-associated domain EAD1-containing protein n=1 Tax=Nostoc sp. TaxID=1180 RepID=UPI002FF69806